MSPSAGTPRVTVVMPAYNAAADLDRSIGSILRQDMGDWELVCIDDASTDGTWAKLQDYARMDPRIRILRHEHNKGHARTRRLAYQEGRGRYFAALDADDHVAADYLSSLLRDAEDKDADAVTADMMFQQGVGGHFRSFYEINSVIPGQVISGREAFSLTFPWRIGGMGLWPAHLIKTIGTAEDNSFNNYNADEYLTRALFLGCRKVCLGSAQYFYALNPASVSRAPSLKKMGELETNERLRALARDNDIPPADMWRILMSQRGAFVRLSQMCRDPRLPCTPAERRQAQGEIRRAFATFAAELRAQGRAAGVSAATVEAAIWRLRARMALETHVGPAPARLLATLRRRRG